MSYSPLPPTLRSILSEVVAAVPIGFTIEFWGSDTLSNCQPEQSPDMAFKIHHPGVIRQLILKRDSLVLVEAYLRGYLDLFGKIADLKCLDRFDEIEVGGIRAVKTLWEAWQLPDLEESLSVEMGWNHLSKHTKERDLQTVQYHYDRGNDFFSLYLDPLMVYTCAYFAKEDMSLKEAQEAKLDRICRKLRLRSGETFLDIGCGWGSLLVWAVEKYDVKGYGITLAQKQYEYCCRTLEEKGLGDRLTFKLLDYRDLPTVPTFDKIASIGMVEHVGRDNYSDYFKSVLRCLKPGGLFLNHGMTSHIDDKPDSLSYRFTQRYVSEDVELPLVSTYLMESEKAGWEVVDVDNWRPHYAKTFAAWAKLLETNMERGAELLGDRMANLWLLYLVGMSVAFDRYDIGVQQMLLRPKAERQWNLPMTREGWL